jgi:hypothetical protein
MNEHKLQSIAHDYFNVVRVRDRHKHSTDPDTPDDEWEVRCERNHWTIEESVGGLYVELVENKFIDVLDTELEPKEAQFTIEVKITE